MKTLLLSLLCLFVWSRHTEAVTDQQVTLGQNVTVACEFTYYNVTWFVIKPSARPIMIKLTKYSEGSRNPLMISNVSRDDLGVYYCISSDWFRISAGIRLHFAGALGDWEQMQNIFILLLALLIFVMFAIIIGLLIKNHKLSKTFPKTPTYVNGHQILKLLHERNRKIMSPQTNQDRPQRPMSDHTYKQQESEYENTPVRPATYMEILY